MSTKMNTVDDKLPKKKANLYRHKYKNLLSELKSVIEGNSLSMNETLSVTLSTIKLDNVISNSDTWPSSFFDFDVKLLLEALATTAMVFDESGAIVYESHNLAEQFISLKTLVRQIISKIIFNNQKVLYNVFSLCRSEVICQMKRSKMSYYRKSNNFMVLKGKIVTSVNGVCSMLVFI